MLAESAGRARATGCSWGVFGPLGGSKQRSAQVKLHGWDYEASIKRWSALIRCDANDTKLRHLFLRTLHALCV